MSSNRRNFLKNISLLSGTFALGIPDLQATTGKTEKLGHAAGSKNFNMCGYAAPKIPKVRIGVIGLGMRGEEAVRRLAYIDGAEIVAVCDKYKERTDRSASILSKRGLGKPMAYYGEDGWKKMVSKQEFDLVYICTPWALHTPMSLMSMKNNKHVACEVPIALTLDDCWELVETSEKTKKHCMMLENCCYDFFEMLTLNMARNGLFGELVHAEGAYIHDLRSLNYDKKGYADMWRLKENNGNNGNLYPTHGLGPVAQCMNINRGDKLDYLVSMSSNDFMMAGEVRELSSKDSYYNPYVSNKYRGNMNTSVIRTDKGKTIMIQHDVTTPRPYSRIHVISGTKGIASKYPSPERIAFGHSWVKEAEMKDLYSKYTPPIIKHVGEIAKKIGGHGGMDFIMDWRLIDCLRNGLPLDQDVYDAASWSCITPLSKKSVESRSRSVDVPDFTRGSWKTNKPVDLTLNGGGNTGVKVA